MLGERMCTSVPYDMIGCSFDDVIEKIKLNQKDNL